MKPVICSQLIIIRWEFSLTFWENEGKLLGFGYRGIVPIIHFDLRNREREKVDFWGNERESKRGSKVNEIDGA